MPGFCVHSLLIKFVFKRVSAAERERLCLKERVTGRSQGAVLLNFPRSKAPQCDYIQAGKSACARCLLCRSQGPPELEQRGVCSYCPSPEWQLSVGLKDGPGGPVSHIQGRRTVLTETMSFAFKPSIRRCLNVNACGHSLILSDGSRERCLHGSGCY